MKPDEKQNLTPPETKKISPASRAKMKAGIAFFAGVLQIGRTYNAVDVGEMILRKLKRDHQGDAPFRPPGSAEKLGADLLGQMIAYDKAELAPEAPPKR